MRKRGIKLSEICELNKSSINKDDHFDKIVYLDTGSITRNDIEGFQILNPYEDKIPSRAKRKVKDGTIIYSTVRPVQEHFGFIQDPLENLIVSTGFVTLDIIDEDIDPLYIYYLITQKHISEYLHGIAENSVTSYPSISPSDLGDLTFNVPSLIEDQRRISLTVRSFDSKITLNNRINQELEAVAKLIYDYWFVQFDFPDENGKPYKSSGGQMVYDEQLKRGVPEGWGIGTLSDIADLVRGVAYNKDDIKSANDDEVTPILRATNITGNVIDLEDMVYVSNELVNENQLIKKFDILITMSSGSKDHIGKNGFFYFEDKVAFGTFCAKLVAKDDFKYYLFSYTQSGFMFDTIRNECLGTNINNLNGSLVKGFKMVIPPLNLIKIFNQKVNPIYNKIANNLQENQKLSELRDWLLPMLMNGQVSVRDTAIATPAGGT